MTSFQPLVMTGHDRTYMAPRSVRKALSEAGDPNSDLVRTGKVTAWDLFRLQDCPQAAEWAGATLDNLVASVETEGSEALGCADCADTGFYGVADALDPDLLTGLVRRTGDGAYESLAADGSWSETTCDGSVEVLDLDTAADLAVALASGAPGLLRRFYVPKAWLPPTQVLAAAPLADVLSGEETADPQAEWVMYAVVDEADPGAVIDLVRLRPGSDADRAEVFDGASWVPDDAVLASADLPMVQLDASLASGIQEAITQSAIVADAPLTVSPDPRAEKLRRYWSTGKGAAKIRWGTPGDAKRCHRHLEKYMPGRAWAYCNNLHRRNTGMWTGDKRNRNRLGGGAVDSPVRLASGVVLSLGDRLQVQGLEAETYSAEVIDGPALRNRLDPQLMGQAMDVLTAAGLDGQNAVAVVLDRTSPHPMRTEVARPGTANFAKVQKALLDRPAMAVNDAAFRVGAVLTPSPEEVLGAKAGVPDVISAAITAALTGWAGRSHRSAPQRVAVLLPATVVSLAEAPGDDRSSRALVDHTRGHDFHSTPPEVALMASIRSGQWAWDTERNEAMAEPSAIPDGVYSETDESFNGILTTLTAGGFPVAPPEEWFANPKLSGPTPLTVTDEGRVFGHIATFDVTHIGMAGKIKPPRSASEYSFYKTGVIKAAGGKDIPVGQITLSGGHAPMHATAAQAVQHYDSTNSAAADVNCGEDSYGIWVAGGVRPGITPEQVRALRASAPSGDWRDINGHLELVAVCQVNVPGFPVARAMAASGAVLALVAAGARPLAELKASEHTSAALLTRMERLEQAIEVLTAAQAPAELVVEDPESADEDKPEDVDDEEDQAESESPVETESAAEGEPEGDPREALRKTVLDARRAAIRDSVAAAGKIPPQFLKNIKKKQQDAEDAQDNGADEDTEDAKGKKKKPVAAAGPLPKTRTIPGTDSFPIKTVGDLKNAIQAFGRAKDKPAAKRHIIRQAMALGHPELIPDGWKQKSNA